MLPCWQTFLERYRNLGTTTILVLVSLVMKESDRKLSTSDPQSPVEVQQLMPIAGCERSRGVQKPALSKRCYKDVRSNGRMLQSDRSGAETKQHFEIEGFSFFLTGEGDSALERTRKKRKRSTPCPAGCLCARSAFVPPRHLQYAQVTGLDTGRMGQERNSPTLTQGSLGIRLNCHRLPKVPLPPNASGTVP